MPVVARYMVVPPEYKPVKPKQDDLQKLVEHFSDIAPASKGDVSKLEKRIAYLEDEVIKPLLLKVVEMDKRLKALEE